MSTAAKTLWTVAGIVAVGVIVVVLGFYLWQRMHKSGAGGGNPTGGAAMAAAPQQQGHAAKGHGGHFQPPVSNLKSQMHAQRNDPRPVESLHAGFTQKLAGIDDLGLPDDGCNTNPYTSAQGQKVDIHNLVPNSWRDPAHRAAEDPCTEDMDTNWAAHAPTSKQFKTFIRASGIAAFGTSDHVLNPSGRIDGLNRATNPPAPTSGRAHFMNDSEARQSALVDTLGDIEEVAGISCL